MIWWPKPQTDLWYLDYLPRIVIETLVLSYGFRICFLRRNLRQISAEIPNILLSSKALVIEHILESLMNECFIRTKSTLWTRKSPKNYLDTCWWKVNWTHQKISCKFWETYLATDTFILSPPQAKWTVQINVERIPASRDESKLTRTSSVYYLVDQMHATAVPEWQTTPWENTSSVTFPKIV